MPKPSKDITEFVAPKPLKEDVQPSEIEVTSLQAAMNERFQKNENSLEKMNNLLILGFIILLVMVATLVIMVLLATKSSYDNYSDKLEQYNLLKNRVDKLELNSSGSSSRQ